jgi:mono/diheme cytochrome c family protein
MENHKNTSSINSPARRGPVFWGSLVVIGLSLLGFVIFITPSLFEPKPPVPMPSTEELSARALLPEALLRGQAVFQIRCAVCHGLKGEGKVGPNLTDNYWLHGDGSVLSILKISRQGVLDKAMPAWEHVIDGQDLADTAIYVHSLKGTNPPEAKAPQGEPISAN